MHVSSDGPFSQGRQGNGGGAVNLFCQHNTIQKGDLPKTESTLKKGLQHLDPLYSTYTCFQMKWDNGMSVQYSEMTQEICQLPLHSKIHLLDKLLRLRAQTMHVLL